MDLTLLLMAATVLPILVVGWWRWPVKLAPVHDSFRCNGRAPVYRRERITGRLVPTGLTLDAAAVVFSDDATFVLLPPVLRSCGTAHLAAGSELRVKAVTPYPAMQSYFLAE